MILERAPLGFSFWSACIISRMVCLALHVANATHKNEIQ